MSERRRVEVVRVLLDGGPVSLPWQSRQELLAEFRHLDSREALLDAFESVGTSQTVALTSAQKGESLEVIELWSTRVPYEHLPEGIPELRAALADDVAAARPA